MALVYFSGPGCWMESYNINEPDKTSDSSEFSGIRQISIHTEYTGLFSLDEADFFKLKHEGKVRVQELKYSGRDVYPLSAMDWRDKGIYDEKYKIKRCSFLISPNIDALLKGTGGGYPVFTRLCCINPTLSLCYGQID